MSNQSAEILASFEPAAPGITAAFEHAHTAARAAGATGDCVIRCERDNVDEPGWDLMVDADNGPFAVSLADDFGGASVFVRGRLVAQLRRA